MAMGECLGVVRWAVQSRLMVLALQVLCHLVIPDHIPSMEDVSMKTHRHPPHPFLIEYTLGGLDNWDAEYFIFNAYQGYSQHEQTMAFFPLLPATMWTVAHTFLVPFSWVWSERTVMLLSGALINFVAFPLAAFALYLLTQDLSENVTFSRLVTFLFCLNPASVFMSAVYSETLFALFTFSALLALTRGRSWLSTVFIALATATRSNGVVLCGFLAYHSLEHLWKILFKTTKSRQEVFYRVVLKLFVSGLQGAVALAPFILFQYYGYMLYCKGKDSDPEWCDWKVPIPYSYIQDRYWNVGVLRYFEFKQLPNFLLATPMVILSILAMAKYFWNTFDKLKKKSEEYDGNEREVGAAISCYRNVKMRPYVFHLMFLLLFGFFNMHVQVLTRFVSSSSPVIYWAAGLWMLCSLSSVKASHVIQPQLFSLPQVLKAMVKNLWTSSGGDCIWLSKAVLVYFLSYIVLGCALHCNFYPWT